jgi:hypothetical protein
LLGSFGQNEALEDELLNRLGQIEDPVVRKKLIQIGTNVPNGGRIRGSKVEEKNSPFGPNRFWLGELKVLSDGGSSNHLRTSLRSDQSVFCS